MRYARRRCRCGASSQRWGASSSIATVARRTRSSATWRTNVSGSDVALSGWSSVDAERILQAAKRWLYTEAGILDSRDRKENRKLAGSIQKPCKERLKEVGWLRDTSNEKRACKVAGALVEAAATDNLTELPADLA